MGDITLRNLDDVEEVEAAVNEWMAEFPTEVLGQISLICGPMAETTADHDQCRQALLNLPAQNLVGIAALAWAAVTKEMTRRARAALENNNGNGKAVGDAP